MKARGQGYSKPNRCNECTKTYADASWEVAKNLAVACLDLWSAFMSKAGWKPCDPLYGSKDLPESDMMGGGGYPWWYVESSTVYQKTDARIGVWPHLAQNAYRAIF
jgi:hypothetical protein